MNAVAALRSLQESWKRALLCGVGVAIASVAIVLLVSIGLGVQKDVTSQVDGFGASMLIVVPGKINLSMGFNPNFAGKSFLTDQAAKDVAEAKGVVRTSVFSFVGGYISYGKNDAYPLLLATEPAWFQMYKTQIAEGKFFTKDQETQDVCVIGSVAKEDLFGDQDPIGKKVTINNRPYTVVGVTEDKKAENSLFSMQSFANVVYLPIRALQSHEENVQIDRIFAQVDNKIDPKTVIGNVDLALKKTLNEKQFSVLTQEDLLKLIYQVMGILGTLVVGLTSIALFVGGVGIMTVMLLSVGERNKEIGIRLAVGARRRDIFRQFLVESSIIGFVGVVAGLVVSLIVCAILASTTNIKPLVTPGTVFMTFTVGLGVGLIFGIVPAAKAAKLDPVAALRLE